MGCMDRGPLYSFSIYGPRPEICAENGHSWRVWGGRSFKGDSWDYVICDVCGKRTKRRTPGTGELAFRMWNHNGDQITGDRIALRTRIKQLERRLRNLQKAR